MRRTDWIWPIIIVISAAVCGALVFANTGGPVRAVAALWFLGICPGMACVRPMRVKDPLMELTLAIALSITLDTIVGSALVYARAWSPDAGLVILLAIAVVGALFALPRRISARSVAA